MANGCSIEQKSGEIWTGQTLLQPISFKSARLIELQLDFQSLKLVIENSRSTANLNSAPQGRTVSRNTDPEDLIHDSALPKNRGAAAGSHNSHLSYDDNMVSPVFIVKLPREKTG